MQEGPIQNECVETMNALARGIDKILNDDQPERLFGFCLLVFPFGEIDGGLMNYISNADRASMITAMKEFIARAEGHYHQSETKQ